MASDQNPGSVELEADGLPHHVFRRIAAGQLEVLLVSRQEFRTFLLVLGEETPAEQVAEGIGEIVEGGVRDVEMELGRPEIGIATLGVQHVSEHAALGMDHHLLQPAHADFAVRPFFVEGLFEFEAHRDVHQVGGAVAGLQVQQEGPVFGAHVRFLQQSPHEQHLAEGGSGFGQGHGIGAVQRAFLPHQVAVKGVSQLVGQGQHVTHVVVIGHVDTGLFRQGRSRAEGAGTLARPGRPVDPLLIEGLVRVVRKGGISGREGPMHQGPGIFPGRFVLVLHRQGRREIVPSQCIAAHEARLVRQDAAGYIDFREHRFEHGVQRFS